MTHQAMRIVALALPLIAGLPAHAARAEDCAALGLPSEFLAEYFCDRFEEIVESGATRTILPDDQDLPDGPEYEWLQQDLLREAWRVDPKKTLELIQRIRLAGGLPES